MDLVYSVHGAVIRGKGRSAHKCAASLPKSCKGNGPHMAPMIGHGMHLESTYAHATQGLVPLQDWFLVVDKRPEE